MQASPKTELIKKHSKTHARVTKITTAHGEILTPAFMPVGTRAFVNYLTPSDLINTGSQIILGGNTYHMLCSPGMTVIEKLGGMHNFMGWHGPMLTDSGGYQLLSLSANKKICTINEDGAHFRHPITGQLIHMTPTISLETQKIIGADIIMAFDECTPDTSEKEIVRAAMQRTHRWLIESKDYQVKHPNSVYGYPQALFGIIQGGCFEDLRIESTEFILSMELDGVAIGGETIGYNMPKTREIIEWLRPLLPDQQVRYCMGVGLQPQDLIDVVREGIDIFDCVAPTRNARHGSLYCGWVEPDGDWIRFASNEDRGRILIKKSIYALDNQPIMEGCNCHTCKNYTRGYLHYLFKLKSQAYMHLASIHNIHVMQEVCRVMREIVLEDK